MRGIPKPCPSAIRLPQDLKFYESYNLKIYLMIRGLGPDVLCEVEATRANLLDFFCSGIRFYLLLSPYICFISLLYLDLYVLEYDALTKYICVLRQGLS